MSDFAPPKHGGSCRTMASHPKRLLRTREAAAYLSLSAWKLRSLVAEGKLPVVQADESSPFLFDVRDLDNWAEQHKRSGTF